MSEDEQLRNRALFLFNELYGWWYNAIEQIIDSKFYDESLFATWYNRSVVLEKKAREFALAVDNEYGARAWKRASELRAEMRRKRNSVPI